ncbi:MAG TPA: MlaD family protein [Burkholderiales bacterium]|nr:MlaD family protein [Burkholderiales bacterium]
MTIDVDEVPSAAVAPKRRWNVPLVWTIPIVAALIGAWVAVKAVWDKGPEIEISFQTAEGLEAGQTKLKYKDVQIGVVRGIRVAPDRKSVIVTAELDKSTEKFLTEDTRFWVVRARISGSQISGLGTLLSGSYIGVDPGRSSVLKNSFVGLERQPIVTADLPGKHFVLQAEELGSLDIGSPVFYRRIQVGSVVAYELDASGNGVELKIFVHAPYDKHVQTQSRFWNASGVDLSLDSEGLRVRTEGLAAMLGGGIAFQTPLYVSSQMQIGAQASTVFQLHQTREQALQRPVTEAQQWVLVFNDSVRGLSVGAPVEFMGVPVGEVSAISLQYDSHRKAFQSAVDVSFYPQRLWERVRGERPETSTQRLALMQNLLDKGLRAQLRSGNLITGQLYIALDYFPDAPKVAVNFAQMPLEVPTANGDLSELQHTLRRIAKRLEKVPFDEIGKELNQTLAETAKLMGTVNQDIAPEIRTTLQSVQQTLQDIQRSVATENAPLQQEARETMRELGRAAKALRELAEYLERHPESLIRGKSGDDQ